MKASPNNHNVQVAMYHSSRRLVQPLEVWLACVAEEFLIHHFPHKDSNWRHHQLEYMNWGPYTSKGFVEFRWMNGGCTPLFPAYPETNMTEKDLLNLYEKTRDTWISLHVGSVAIAVKKLQADKEVPVYKVVLPSDLKWMVRFLNQQVGWPSSTLFGCDITFQKSSPFVAVSDEKFGPVLEDIEFPRFTNMTIEMMPDVRIRKD